MIYEYHIKTKTKQQQKEYIYAAQRRNGKYQCHLWQQAAHTTYQLLCPTAQQEPHTQKRSDLLTKTIVKERLTKWHKGDNENHVRICVWPLVILLP